MVIQPMTKCIWHSWFLLKAELPGSHLEMNKWDFFFFRCRPRIIHFNKPSFLLHWPPAQVRWPLVSPQVLGPSQLLIAWNCWIVLWFPGHDLIVCCHPSSILSKWPFRQTGNKSFQNFKKIINKIEESLHPQPPNNC